jgi:hypothetical protein
MRTAFLVALVAATLAASFMAAPAMAQRDRVFVASYGSDSNPCTFGSPCKTFQNAVNVVAVGGEVTAIDSAGFGPVTITQSVTITSPAGVEAGIAVAAGNAGITITAPGAKVSLRGLTVDGMGVGYNGIVFNSGSSLTVTDCVARNMVAEVIGPEGIGPMATGSGANPNTGNGILLAPTSGPIDIAITNTTVSSNGNTGLRYLPPSGSPTVNAIFDRITATANGGGINVDSSNASGGTTSINLTNSIASNNSGQGIFANSMSAAVGFLIDNVNASSNASGISAGGPTNVVLGRSVVTNNSVYGIDNGTPANTFYTYKNNEIYLNGDSNAVLGNPLTDVTYQ